MPLGISSGNQQAVDCIMKNYLKMEIRSNQLTTFNFIQKYHPKLNSLQT